MKQLNHDIIPSRPLSCQLCCLWKCNHAPLWTEHFSLVVMVSWINLCGLNRIMSTVTVNIKMVVLTDAATGQLDTNDAPCWPADIKSSQEAFWKSLMKRPPVVSFCWSEDMRIWKTLQLMVICCPLDKMTFKNRQDKASLGWFQALVWVSSCKLTS